MKFSLLEPAQPLSFEGGDKSFILVEDYPGFNAPLTRREEAIAVALPSSRRGVIQHPQ